MNPNETCFNVLGNEIVFPTQYFHYNWISYSYMVTYRDGHGCMLRELDMSHLAYTDCESVTNIYSIRPAIWLYQLWLNFLLKLKLTIFTFDRQQEMLVQSVTNSHWSLIRRHKISRRSLELFNTKSIDFKKWNVELAPIFCYPICSLKLWRWLIVGVSAILLFLSFRFFFSRSWQKRRPLLPSSNYNLQYIPFIVTTYSAHVVFKCNAFTNRIGVCYQVCYCTPCQIYLNYSTRLHSTYIKRWGFYGLIIGDQRAQTCCISINFLRKFWSGSVEESLSGPPILS